MGSNKLKDWTCFEKAAKENKNIIFVVSAGNNSFNIDQNPIYPASLDLKNILTVTSSDQSGRLGRGSNYGEKSVDFMLPAERLEVIDHRGVKAFAGGTSYAAPRLAALISRYIENNPNCTNDEIYDFLKKRAIQKGKKLTKFGWIPDPEDNYLIN
jgi:subtilisin family serine protease